MHHRRSARLLSGSAPERDDARVSLRRSLGFAAVVLLAACAGCSHRDIGPAPGTMTVVVPAATPVALATTPLAVATTPLAVATTPVAVATTAIVPAPARVRPCGSDAECGANPTGGLCLPNAGTRELADAEDFLRRVMRLDDLIIRLGDSSSSSELGAIQQRARDDVAAYGRAKQGLGADGTSVLAPGVRSTPAQQQEMQDAAWMQSGATQAEWSIQQFSHALSSAPVTTDAQKIHADVTGLEVEHVLGDLQTFLQDIEVAVAPVNKLITLRQSDGSPLTPKSGAGALLLYLGPVMQEIEDARSRVTALLDSSAISRRKTALTRLSQRHALLGKDGSAGTCLSPGDAARGAGAGGSSTAR